jgi:hypothetical protein
MVRLPGQAIHNSLVQDTVFLPEFIAMNRFEFDTSCEAVTFVMEGPNSARNSGSVLRKSSSRLAADRDKSVLLFSQPCTGYKNSRSDAFYASTSLKRFAVASYGSFSRLSAVVRAT